MGKKRTNVMKRVHYVGDWVPIGRTACDKPTDRRELTSKADLVTCNACDLQMRVRDRVASGNGRRQAIPVVPRKPGPEADPMNEATGFYPPPSDERCEYHSNLVPSARCLRAVGHLGAHHMGVVPPIDTETVLAQMVAQSAARVAGVPENGRIHAGPAPMSDLQKVVVELLVGYVSADPYADPQEFIDDLTDDLSRLDPGGHLPTEGLSGLQQVEAGPLYRNLIARVRVAEAVGSRRSR